MEPHNLHPANANSDPGSIDILLPCYNPPQGWAGFVCKSFQDISRALPRRKLRLILVNDGTPGGLSQADTEKVRMGIAPAELLFIHCEINQGKGAALRKGASKSDAAVTLFTDIDFPYTKEAFLNVLKTLDEGCDIAAGIRDEAYYRNVPAVRRFISRFLRFLLRSFLRLRISDTQCGLKGFNARGRELFLSTRINRFLFDMEFIFLASQRNDIVLKGVPVQLRPGVIFSTMNGKILVREGWNFLGIFFRFLFRR